MFFFCSVLLSQAVYSQTVEVIKESFRVEGENTTGYQVALAGSEEEIRTSLAKYLKATGRTRQSGDYITIAGPLIESKKYAGTLYATTRPSGQSAAAWIGMRPESGEETALNRDLEKLVRDFGVAFHREKIQIQIDESLRALQAVERQQSRLVNQNKDLQARMTNNKKEKIELEQSLVNNKLELEDLTKKLEANTKAQDSVAVATEQIKKVVEMHREKQRNVH